MNAKALISPEYVAFVADLKRRIAAARMHAARAVNRDLVLLYWDMGRGIVEKQETLGWGESVSTMNSWGWTGSLAAAEKSPPRREQR